MGDLVNTEGLALIARRLEGLGALKTVRRDVLLAISGFKASRLLLTEAGVKELRRLQCHVPFAFSCSPGKFELVPDETRGNFFNGMLATGAAHGLIEVFVATDEALTEELARERDDPELVGHHLGIPECCVRFYLDHAETASRNRFDYSIFTPPLGSLQLSLLPCVLGRYFDLGLVDHFPCRYDCPATVMLAGKAALALRQVDEPLVFDLLAPGTYLVTAEEGTFRLAEHQRRSSGPCCVRDRSITSSRLAVALDHSDAIDLMDGTHIRLRAPDVSWSEWPRPVRSLTFTVQPGDWQILPELPPLESCTTSLEGRQVLVVGTSKIGISLAACLACHGARVAFASRSAERRRSAVHELSLLLRPGPGAPSFEVNLDDPYSCETLLTRLGNAGFVCDSIVFAAGSAEIVPTSHLSDHAFLTALQTHTLGPHRLCRSLFSQEPGRAVVFLSSRVVLDPEPGYAAYAAAKGALEAYARHLAEDLHPLQGPVVLVRCGPIEPDLRRPPRPGYLSIHAVGAAIAEALASQDRHLVELDLRFTDVCTGPERLPGLCAATAKESSSSART